MQLLSVTVRYAFSRSAASLLLGTLLLAPATLSGQDFTYSLSFENDTFASSDDSYTNGVRLSRMRAFDDLRGWPDALRRRGLLPVRICTPEAPSDCFSASFGEVVVQTMYTPTELTRSDVLVHDRPYAGWLFGGLAGRLVKGRQQHYAEITAGILGPSSGAESAQKFVHEYLVPSAPDPLGWDNQISHTATLNARYQFQRPIDLWKWNGMRLLDVVPHAGFNAGSVITYGNAGATARFGLNVDEFAPERIMPTARTPSFRLPTLYVFARFDARLIGHNLLLEGNNAPSRRNFSHERNVNDQDYGLVFAWRRVRLSYTYVGRSGEFEGGRDQEFGAISVAYTN